MDTHSSRRIGPVTTVGEGGFDDRLASSAGGPERSEVELGG
jgi:hypothetical protein